MTQNIENTEVFQMVIPAAGWGTRFLPITKTIPKEMLPLGSRPAIEWVIEEANQAGIKEIAIITNNKKPSIEQYFSIDNTHQNLEDLSKRNQHAAQKLQKLRDYPDIKFINQKQQLGLGHAVEQAKDFVNNQPFVVALPDDIFHPEDALLSRMIQVRKRLGGSVVALIKVNEEEAMAYGCAKINPVFCEKLEGITQEGEVFALSDIIEKPTREQIRSPYGMVGRYVLDPLVMKLLPKTPPGRGGEIQLTDALASASEIEPAKGGGVWGVVARGRRFDTGNPLQYTKAIVELALDDPQYGKKFASWLESMTLEHRT